VSIHDGFHEFMASKGLPVPCNGCDSVDYEEGTLNGDGYCLECVDEQEFLFEDRYNNSLMKSENDGRINL